MISLSTRSISSAAWVLVLSLGGAALLPSCGGSKGKGAAAPSSNVATKANTATTPPPQEVGMSDLPSDGEPADRPRMNANAKAAYLRGMQLWQGGDLAGARAAFTEATQADPKAYQAFYSLGVVQERLGQGDALNAYRQAYTVVPNYEPAIVAYSMALARRGSLAEADDFLSDRKGRMPRSAALLTALAEIKSLRHDTGTAQQLAQESLKLNPDYKPAMVTLARDHYRNRRLDLALYALRAILDGEDANNPPRDKNNAEAHLLRAVIWKEQGLRGAAIDEFKKAVSLRPDLVESRVQLAGYLLESGNAEEALPLLESALRFNKDHVIAHLDLGDAYRLLGRTTDSKRELDYVTSRDTSLPQAYYSLGLLYLFSPSVPGMDGKQQIANAIAALEKYQQLRGKPMQGSNDDSDQLLLRAKAKQGELNASEQAANAPAPAGSGGGAAPAGSAAGAGAASAPAAAANSSASPPADGGALPKAPPPLPAPR